MHHNQRDMYYRSYAQLICIKNKMVVQRVWVSTQHGCLCSENERGYDGKLAAGHVIKGICHNKTDFI